jgi:hypothetical protein
MTEHERTPDGRECGGDVAAYALGALTPEEAAEFRGHLESCAICRDELNAFVDVVDALPLTVPQRHAPAAVRRNVLREVTAHGQPSGERSDAVPTRPAHRRWGLPQAALAFGAVVLAAVIVFVAVQLSSSSSQNRVIQAQVIGSGAAELRIAGGHASLVLHHFAPPPPGKIYELWIQRAHQAPSPTTALFSVNRAGSGTVGVPGGLNGVLAVLVTPEPAGGSQAPTHTPIISVSLT